MIRIPRRFAPRLVALAGLALAALPAQQAPPDRCRPEAADEQRDALRVELDAVVRGFLGSRNIPGLAVGVVRGGEVLFAKGYGVARPAVVPEPAGESDRADPSVAARPVTTRSLFHTASVSKTFVATAIMQLAAQDRLDLDAPCSNYVSYFAMDDARAAAITIRQMLNHTSGMPDVRDYGWEHPEADDMALERYVRGLRSQQLLFAPGTRWSYSNMAYEVLGDVVAKVSGMPFETYMKEHVLAPVGMQKSTFLLEEVDPELRTTPNVGRREPAVSEVYPYHRAHAPSSTLHSNIEEMCLWILVNSRRGNLGATRLLPDAAYDQLWRAQVRASADREIGLAWFLGESPHGRWAFHGGRDPGFRSHVSIFPDHEGGIVILSNYSETPIRPLREALAKAAFGQ